MQRDTLDRKLACKLVKTKFRKRPVLSLTFYWIANKKRQTTLIIIHARPQNVSAVALKSSISDTPTIWEEVELSFSSQIAIIVLNESTM